MSRPLLPAPRRGGEGATADASQAVFSKIQIKGRTHVAIACNACRKSKSKCDGVRPICTKCHRGKKECAYVTQAETLAPQVLKRKHRQLEERCQDLEYTLECLSSLPPEQAGAMFQRYPDVEDLVRLFRNSHVLLQLSGATDQSAKPARGPK